MIQISENLRRLRRERDVTQEELAATLGVAAQSVSKWERGENFPDITLLPALANYFEVTTDELIGMDEIRDEERVRAVREDFHKLHFDGKIEEAIELYRDLVRDLPHDWEVQLEFASHLSSGWYAESGEKELEILMRVYEKCSDGETRLEAIRAIARYHALRREYDTATMWANKLPTSAQLRDDMLLEVALYAQDRAAMTMLREKVSDNAERAAAATYQLIALEESQFKCADSQEHIAMVESIVTLYDIAYNRFGTERIENIKLYVVQFLRLAERYCTTGEPEKACDYVELSVEYQLREGNFPLTSGYGLSRDPDGNVTVIEPPPATTMFAEMIQHFQQTDAFDPLRTHPRFIAALARLRA